MGKNRKIEITKALIILAVPTMLEQILSTLLQYIDTAMVGRMGEQATAAVSVTTTINWLIGSMASAIGVAIIAMISKGIGGGDEESIKKISMQAFFLAICSGIVLGMISVLLSPFIPIWMGAEEEIQKQASIYFAIISVPMIFRTSTTILGAALRATKDTKTPMFINMFANILNIGLNYCLIYVAGLGVTGAAIGSSISFTISGCLTMRAYFMNTSLKWKLKEFSIDQMKLHACIKLGLPVMETSITSCLGYIVFAALVSGMGTTIFAAHSIAVTAETIFYISGYGLRTATSTMVGISLGEKDQRKFTNISQVSIMVTLIMMSISGCVLFCVAEPLMRLLTNSEEVVVLGARMLKLVAFSEPFFGLMIVLEGILYGLGKTKYPFYVETGGMWGIRILMTALCVKVWHLGLTSVWLCMIADNVIKAVLLAIPMFNKRYRRNLFIVANE